ncbi:MAG: hypothetical protein A2355_02570 [Spirochaetes bacterium RIFOXYB1_FULL_32_8]|nr:MAG: hypothetical protein A2Y29_01505 [Spirochaetes bacterium GWE2_31_10]OHD74106.1 MAG: hypothetical protein A2355_02570 [Spirochaetes bacterium RIFOXYB1_FULL_32_8]HBD94635.1 hypothetical protein [Spirochaetia bacterium]HBI39249.1 hypothetical protein [Spirochaetia bacterium]
MNHLSQNQKTASCEGIIIAEPSKADTVRKSVVFSIKSVDTIYEVTVKGELVKPVLKYLGINQRVRVTGREKHLSYGQKIGFINASIVEILRFVTENKQPVAA